MITLQDVQRGYDAWAAKPHNAKWVKKIDGTPIANDIVVNIFEALKVAPVGWETQAEWDLENRAFSAANDPKLPERARTVIEDLWRQYCAAASPYAPIVDELIAKLRKLPKADRGISWRLRNWCGAEELTVYSATANLCKFVLDNDEALIAALAKEDKS